MHSAHVAARRTSGRPEYFPGCPATILYPTLLRGTIVQHSMALTPGTRLGPYQILVDYGIKKGLAVPAKTE